MPQDPAADHLDGLYLTDGQGRMIRINQWDGGKVPRFHLVRSSRGNYWRFRDDLDADLVLSLERLCRGEPVGADLRADPALTDGCLDLLGRTEPVRAIWRGPVYLFPPQPRSAADDGVVALTDENAGLLSRWLPDWLPDVAYRQPFLAAVVDGAAVSVCASVRITPRAHAAGVETHPRFRNRGFAHRAVRAWSEAVRRAGAAPIYSTSWENAASQGVARSLGLSLIATDFHVS